MSRSAKFYCSISPMTEDVIVKSITDRRDGTDMAGRQRHSEQVTHEVRGILLAQPISPGQQHHAGTGLAGHPFRKQAAGRKPAGTNPSVTLIFRDFGPRRRQFGHLKTQLRIGSGQWPGSSCGIRRSGSASEIARDAPAGHPPFYRTRVSGERLDSRSVVRWRL